MKIMDKISITRNYNEVFERLFPNKKKKDIPELQELITTASSLISPKILYTTAFVTNHEKNLVNIDGVRFRSRVLAKNLERIERVFPYVITIGKALEQEATSCKDVLKQLYLENIGDTALNSTELYLKNHLLDRYQLGKVSSMSPGSLEDWPITEQTHLFSLFDDVEKRIGVKLTENLVMIPRKSISGILFPTEILFMSCQLCSRKNCSSRQAEFDENLKKSYGID